MTEQKSINGGKPNPDPSILTTENLRREIDNLKELLESQQGAQDRTIAAIQHNIDGRQEQIDAAIVHITTLFEVKFDGVEKQFVERDKRTEQLSIADKTAIAAALQAQKEAAGATNESNSIAINKMENNFTTLINKGESLLQSVQKNLDDKIADLKTRFDTGEGQNRGKTAGVSSIGALAVGASFIISMLVAVAALIITFTHH
jgi:hypothetical protein